MNTLKKTIITVLSALSIMATAGFQIAKAQDTHACFGEIRMFTGNFTPTGWVLCLGQLLPISQYQALFSLLGTTCDGDGRSTIVLSDYHGFAC
jgi:hypothetical protein